MVITQPSTSLFSNFTTKETQKVFDDDTAEDMLDDFLTNRVSQGILFSDFVHILNMKAASNVGNPQKMEILTEILNDLKLFVCSMDASAESH